MIKFSKIKNFSKGEILTGFLSTDVNFYLKTSQGTKFPSTGSTQVFIGVFWDKSYQTPAEDTTREIVKCYRSTGDTFNFVLRGAEGTIAKNWNADDNFALTITAGKLEELQDEILATSGVFAEWDNEKSYVVSNITSFSGIIYICTNNNTNKQPDINNTFWIPYVDPNNKGYFLDQTALNSAYPTGLNGWFAIVGSTNSVWVWDNDTSIWTNTGNSATVNSVFGRMGIVVAMDGDYNSSQITHDNTGDIYITSDNVADALDELDATAVSFDGRIDKIENIQTVAKFGTGFSSPKDVVVAGDATNRIITLTGTTTAYYLGNLVSALVSGWVSTAHNNTPGSNFFLSYDGISFSWTENIFPGFDKVQIASAIWDASNSTWFYARECHGLITSPDDHLAQHTTIGTYKYSGGTIPSASYVLNSTTATDRRLNIDQTTIRDEDCPSVLDALTSKLYTKMTLTGASISNFAVETAEIVPVLGNNPYYNLFSTPNWTQVLMANNSVATVWIYAIPVARDTASKKYRYVFVQPQWVTLSAGSSTGQITTAVNTEEAREVKSLNLGSLAINNPEMIAIARVTIVYTGSNWSYRNVLLLTGNKYSQIGSPAGNFLSEVATDATLTGNGTVTSPLGLNIGKATGSEIDTGTDNVKYVSPKAITDSKVVLADKQTSGNILKTPKTGIFASGATTYQKTDSTVTANSLVDVYAQGTTIGQWSVESYAGYFIITSTKTETSNVNFSYFINNI